MSLTALARLRLAGRLCRRGSWFILAVGLIVSICLFFAVTADPGPGGLSPIQQLLSFAFPG
ncbi:MAG: hypothetical protein J2P36_36515, partial [Ktedonobacteraceae bacterium]|nr:hypothetical protein [Ktedonobacteraceae bacterium]